MLRPIFPGDPLVVACIMHLLLCIVCIFWRYYVQRYVTTETRATAIVAHLETLGVATKKLKKQFEKQVSEKKGDDSEKAPPRPTFNGDACFTVLKHFDSFLDFTTELDSKRRPRVEAAIAALIVLLKCVSPKLNDEGAEAEDGAAG